MRKMKVNVERPWLTSTGVEIPTERLREISKSWSPAIWEEYLNWYESGCREKLVVPWIYETAGDQQTDSVFVQFGHDTSPENQRIVEHLFSQAPKDEALVLRKIFLHGQTVREVAAETGLPKSTVHDLKFRALSRLNRGISGDLSDTPQLVRGVNNSSPQDEQSIWDEPLNFPLKEDRAYALENHKTEFAQIKTSSVMIALTALSDLSARVLYLRYWCGFSLKETARAIGRAANVISAIEASAILRVKRSAIENETRNFFLGGAQC